MMYELRTYRAMPGRLPDIVAKFKNHTVPLWDRHKIHHVGFWTVLVGESNHDFIYLLRWDSLDERDAKWAAFTADPAWAEAKRQTEANGPITANVANQFLLPTAFSGLQ